MSNTKTLVALRKVTGCSQANFASGLGLSKSVVANYESGRTPPKSKMIDKICLALGLQREDFSFGLLTTKGGEDFTAADWQRAKGSLLTNADAEGLIEHGYSVLRAVEAHISGSRKKGADLEYLEKAIDRIRDHFGADLLQAATVANPEGSMITLEVAQGIFGESVPTAWTDKTDIIEVTLLVKDCLIGPGIYIDNIILRNTEASEMVTLGRVSDAENGAATKLRNSIVSQREGTLFSVRDKMTQTREELENDLLRSP